MWLKVMFVVVLMSPSGNWLRLFNCNKVLTCIYKHVCLFLDIYYELIYRNVKCNYMTT